MVATIVASMSGMTRHSLTCTPSRPSSVARYWILASRVRPLRISLPMTTMQAVTVFAGSDIATLIFLFFQDTSGGPPGGQAPHGLVTRRYRMPNMGHEQPPRFHRRQRRLLAARRADDQGPRARGLRGHAPRRPAGGRDARLHHARMSQPGVTTDELDKLCHDYILDHKAIPAPLGYRGYPKSICTSINHVVCHGIPARQAPAGRRHRQHRRHGHPRRLVRRHQPHVLRRATSA